MEEERLVYRFQKNQDEEVRISLREYKDRRYLDLRIWFQPSGGGDLHPTKKGLFLALEYVPELRKGLERAEKLREELALHPASNSVK